MNQDCKVMTGKDDVVRKGTETTNIVVPVVVIGSVASDKKKPLNISIILLIYIIVV